MGVSTNFVIGPMLVLKGTVNVDVESRVCSQSPKKHGRQSSAFCPKCGSAVIEKVDTVAQDINLYNLPDQLEKYEELLDSLTSTDYDRGGPIWFDQELVQSLDPTDDANFTEIQPENIPQLIQLFTEKYGDFLEEVRKLGATCEVKYGAIAFYW